MKKTTYNITTKNGKQWQISFVETQQEGDYYGNGKYIHVLLKESSLSIDCRYNINYNFTTICEEWLKAWYGENLASFEKIA